MLESPLSVFFLTRGGGGREYNIGGKGLLACRLWLDHLLSSSQSDSCPPPRPPILWMERLNGKPETDEDLSFIVASSSNFHGGSLRSQMPDGEWHLKSFWRARPS